MGVFGVWFVACSLAERRCGARTGKTYRARSGASDNRLRLATTVKSGHATNDGYADQLQGPMETIKLSMDLVWRSLGVWATVLAILLLVNVIA